QRLAPPAAALQAVRRPELDTPVRDFARLLVLDVDVDPDVRIRPVDLRDDAGQADRLLGVELGRERMMRGRVAASEKKPAQQKTRQFSYRHRTSPCARIRSLPPHGSGRNLRSIVLTEMRG